MTEIIVLFVIYNLAEISLQRSATYKTAVDVSLCKQLCRISCIYGSAVLDTDCFCCSLVVYFSNALTDALAYFLSLLCCSCLACSDCPDRLVSDDHCLSLISSYILKTNFNLLTDKVHCHALLSLLQSLAAAHDRCDAVLECFEDFLIYIFICLAKVISSLRVSENYIFNACIYKHSRRNLACVSSALLEIHILSSDLDVCSFCCLDNRNNIDSRYTEYYVNFFICY